MAGVGEPRFYTDPNDRSCFDGTRENGGVLIGSGEIALMKIKTGGDERGAAISPEGVWDLGNRSQEGGRNKYENIYRINGSRDLQLMARNERKSFDAVQN